jgi:hypothetical protein
MKAEVLQASGTAEEEAALEMLDRRQKQTKSGKKAITLGADKKYDHRGFVEAARERNVIVHVSQTVGMLRKLMYRGLRLVNWVFTFRMAVYNLVRLNNLGVTAG